MGPGQLERNEKKKKKSEAWDFLNPGDTLIISY